MHEYIAIWQYIRYDVHMASGKYRSFEWDSEKDTINQEKHGVRFILAQYAFVDPKRIIMEDVTHSTESEKRYFCLGMVGDGVLTVRFTYRKKRIRIFGAGYWRKGREIYEKRN